MLQILGSIQLYKSVLNILRKALMLRILLIVLFLPMLSSCWSFLKNKYISLENYPNAMIIKMAKVKIRKEKRGQNRYIWSKEIPVSYMIQRSQYELKMTISPSNIPASISISLSQDSKNKGYHFKVEHRKLEHYPSGGPCYVSGYTNVNKNEFYYLWCNNPSRKMQIEFEVLDAGGEIIAKELLPFDVKVAGLLMVPGF